MARKSRKPKLAVWKFASCDGCQLTLLDCEEELLAIADAIEIAYFPEATRAVVKGPYDLSLVEGSITTYHDAKRIHEVRATSKTLIAIGACATAGGIQSLRNFADVGRMTRTVYPHPEFIETLARSSPISEHVKVDFELRGCPIAKVQLVDLVVATLSGRRPFVPRYSVCIECKQQGNVCTLVARGQACLGPATQAGCGAICPSFGRGCYGCFGPSEAASFGALDQTLALLDVSPEERLRLFRSFNAEAASLRNISTELEHRGGS